VLDPFLLQFICNIQLKIENYNYNKYFQLNVNTFLQVRKNLIENKQEEHSSGHSGTHFFLYLQYI